LSSLAGGSKFSLQPKNPYGKTGSSAPNFSATTDALRKASPCEPRAPVLAVCRKLTSAGFDPSRPLHAYRGDTLSLKVRSIGEGARLTVDETRTAFARWKPFSHAAVSSQIARAQSAATCPAGGER